MLRRCKPSTTSSRRATHGTSACPLATPTNVRPHSSLRCLHQLLTDRRAVHAMQSEPPLPTSRPAPTPSNAPFPHSVRDPEQAYALHLDAEPPLAHLPRGRARDVPHAQGPPPSSSLVEQRGPVCGSRCTASARSRGPRSAAASSRARSPCKPSAARPTRTSPSPSLLPSAHTLTHLTQVRHPVQRVGRHTRHRQPVRATRP